MSCTRSLQPILVGAPRPARARAEFARDAFTTGGFAVLEPIFAGAVVPGEAALVVLSGDDAAVDAFLADSGRMPPVVVAGPPRATPGVTVLAWIHRGCDLLHALRTLYLAVSPEDDDA